jgi:hypothetical protein
MSHFLYVVYNHTQPSGQELTTAHITFDIVGAFSNHTFHCETTGPDILAGDVGPGGRWKKCTTEDATTAAKYTTSFKYNPGDWNALTLRETSLCGTDLHQMYIPSSF